MTAPDDTASVPDLYLERYRLGELPEDEPPTRSGALDGLLVGLPGSR